MIGQKSHLPGIFKRPQESLNIYTKYILDQMPLIYLNVILIYIYIKKMNIKRETYFSYRDVREIFIYAMFFFSL